MNSPKHPPRVWVHRDSYKSDAKYFFTSMREKCDGDEYLSLKEHEETVSTLLEALKETLVYLRDAQVIGDNNPDPTSDHGRWLAAIAKAEAHD